MVFFSSTIDDLTLLVLPLCNVFSEMNRQATTYGVKILSRFHMLAYFLQIYQQMDVKVLVYIKISRNPIKAFYIFLLDLCMIFRLAVKEHCKAKHIFSFPEGAPLH